MNQNQHNSKTIGFEINPKIFPHLELYGIKFTHELERG